MHGWDPSVVGAIRQEEFIRAYRSRWQDFRAKLESRFRERVVALFLENEGRLQVDAVRDWMGESGDEALGLSCMTERAVDWPRRRWMHVLSPSQGLGDAVAADIQHRAAGDLQAVQVTETATDGWGGVVLLVDELDVTILAPRENRGEGVQEIGRAHV